MGVDLVGARPGYAARTAFDPHVLDVLDHLSLTPRCRACRQNAVVIAVYDHGRQVIARNVLAKVLNPGINSGQGGNGRGADCDRPIGFDDALANQLSVSTANTIEILQELH